MTTKSFLARLFNNSLPVLALLLLPILTGCGGKAPVNASEVLLLFNSNAPESSIAEQKVIPYLNHFGVQFTPVDVASQELPADADPALVIIGHAGIADSTRVEQIRSFLARCQSHGAGILSFDPALPEGLMAAGEGQDPDVGSVRFSDEAHYITGYRKPGEIKELFGYMSVPRTSVKEGRAVITGNDLPLLVVSAGQDARVAQWTSQEWMYYSILGPLGGLDDCLWRSIVWAARKPFVMQALPPLATMRVDDVVGAGREQWDVTPFDWVKTANKYGFKPWMGLFIYNITPEGIAEVKQIMDAGSATGTPHAFGRPPRPESRKENIKGYYQAQLADTFLIPSYWYEKAMPYLSQYYDEFIYFDHNNQKPWAPEVSQKIMQAVDDWYAATGLPMGGYIIPHWGEANADMMSHIKDDWGVDFVAVREVDKSWGQQTPEYNLKEGKQPVRTAPFRLYDEPVVGKKKEGVTTSRAAYNASTRTFGGRDFFDFSSSINDITGYEWKPDNDVDATAERGIKILSRGLEAKGLAVLFTHETDFIYLINPGNWDAILKKVSEGIAALHPEYSTMDDAVKTLRAFNTSAIQSSQYNAGSDKLTVKISGTADVPTSVFVYTGEGDAITERKVEIPAFQNEVSRVVKLTE